MEQINITYDHTKKSLLGATSIDQFIKENNIAYQRKIDKICSAGIIQYVNCENVPEELPECFKIYK